MYDRLTGGTTIIISSGGTTIPGSPTRPEYLKASVYLPPAFVTHHPDLHSHIIDIVQHYIETVGVRTVATWTQRARRDLGYSLTQVGNLQQNHHINAIPTPDYNSAHYMFLGQPYRLTEDPSASSLQSRSQATSTDPYEDAFGKDPDDSALEIIDLQEENNNLREHIHNLQQKICELEEEVNVTNLRKSSLASRTHDRILYLEEQVRKYEYVTDKTTSTPVRNTTSKSTPSNTPLSPLRYRSMTPSHAAPIRAQIQSPDTSFKRQIQPSVGTPTLSRSPFVSHSPFTSSPAEVSPSSCRPLIPYYINLYHLGYLSTSINLIADYTPAESRIEELFKLGLEEDVCQTLANAMALDKGLLND